jgi:hypothetical protein
MIKSTVPYASISIPGDKFTNIWAELAFVGYFIAKIKALSALFTKQIPRLCVIKTVKFKPTKKQGTFFT